MPLKFTTTKDAAQRGIKVLVYGPAGIGKTVLASTAPSPIILSAEAGLLSLKGHNIPVIEIASYKDLLEAFQWLTTSPDAKPFKTVCLDSLTEIAEQVLSSEKESARDVRQAYGELMDKVQRLVKDFRDLDGLNVYFSCKEERKTDDTGITRILPAMPGSKLGGQLPYYFDQVLHYEIVHDANGNPFRALRTAANFNCEAKDRSGALEELEEPNLGKLFNKINGGK